DLRHRPAYRDTRQLEDDLGHGGRRRRRHRNRDKLTLNRRLGTAFGRTAPLVNQVRVNTVAQRHTGDGSLRGLALLKNPGFELQGMAAALGGWLGSKHLTHIRCPLGNRWTPTLLGKIALGRWVRRTLTIGCGFCDLLNIYS